MTWFQLQATSLRKSPVRRFELELPVARGRSKCWSGQKWLRADDDDGDDDDDDGRDDDHDVDDDDDGYDDDDGDADDDDA